MKQLLLIALLLVTLVYSQDVATFCNSFATSCQDEYDADFGDHTDQTTCVNFYTGLISAVPTFAGTNDATIDNTLGCRQFQLETLGDCAAARTTGETCVEGDICTNYCGFLFSFCNTEDTLQYPDVASCLVHCAAMSIVGALDPTVIGTAGDTSGPSISCRNYHAIAAGRLGTEHCEHAGIIGGGVCGTIEESYILLRLMGAESPESFLQDNFTLYNAEVGEITDTGSDTLGCRLYHSAVSYVYFYQGMITESDLHWSHGSYHGGNVCGDYCTNYCRIVSQQCGRTETAEQCMAQCLSHPVLNTSATVVDTPITGGDSIECRLYHVGVDIYSDPADEHCLHASFSGYGVCGDICENYCNRFNSPDFTSCGDRSAEVSQFQDNDGCLAVCNDAYILGEIDETSGNTLHCRFYHLGVALTYDPDTESDEFNAHCTHAGISGGAVCGDLCENYCYYMSSCPTDSAVQFTVPTETTGSDAECLAACAVMDATALDGRQDGPSLQCRIYHVMAGFQISAAAGDESGSVAHCPHAGFSSESDVCGSVCENLCQFQQNTCGDLPNFQTEADCNTVCESFVSGEIDETSGNSAACRLYHVQVAALNAEDEELRTLHCGHANNDGGEVCGSLCEAYCTLQFAFCPSNFANETDCLSTCDSFSTNGTLGDTSGDTLQCRLYHLVVAATATTVSDTELHCSHSDPSGTGVCVAPSTDTENTDVNTAGTDNTDNTDNTDGTDATDGTGTGSDNPDDTDFSVKLIFSTIFFALALMI